MPDPQPPLVSVLLPAFNAQTWIAEAVRSILDQSFADFELLVIDDHSIDATVETVRRTANADPRVRVMVNPGKGLLAGLNFGIHAAAGTYLARMDADDVSEPSRLEQQVAFLQRHPECVALGTGILCIDAQSSPLFLAPVSQEHGDILNELLYNRPGKICHPTVMMRKRAVETVGAYQQDYHFEDVDLFLRLAHIGRLANLPQPLLRYRLLASSISRTRDPERSAEIYFRISERSAKELGLAAPSRDAFQHAGGSPSPYDLHRDWSVQARRQKFFLSSLKHAWAAFRLSPFAGPSIWSLFTAIMGERTANWIVSLKSRHRNPNA